MTGMARMIGLQVNPGSGLFEFLDRIRSNDGLLVLILIALIWFCCYLLSKAVWKVWRTAMKAKDQEISRLTQERDRYQSIVFERLLGPEDFLILTQKEWPEDEGGGGNSSPDKVH
jgi:hypothetical protein